jgi:transmembrane serine protease 3
MAKLILCSMVLSAVIALALCQTCGKASARARPNREHADGQRIVGGVEARPNSFPFMISLQQYGSHFCGGSLIQTPDTKPGESDIVLTAAHCVYDGVNSLTASAGAHNLQRPTSSQQTVTARKYAPIYHPKYNPQTTMNDIAIIRLDQPIKFTSTVVPICLPAPNDQASGEGTVAGWGLMEEDGDVSPKLNQVGVPVIPTKECQAMYRPQGVGIDGAAMLCAAYKQGGKDSCQGDSGGPFFFKNAQGAFVQQGVVSFGVGCARAGSPGVYTRLSNPDYLSFINQASSKLYGKLG